MAWRLCIAVLVTLPLAAVAFFYMAILCGISFARSFTETLHWALLMADLTILPVALLAGDDWTRYRWVVMGRRQTYDSVARTLCCHH